MSIHVSRRKFSQACSVLFGPDVPHPRTLKSPEWQRELKRAFRRRMMETHPDRAVTLGRPASELAPEFLAATRAYEWLAPLAACNEEVVFQDSTLPTPAPAATPAPRTAPAPVYYRAPIPKRSMRFAEFLYYSGVISWQAMMEAVVWQRRQRPLLGAIAISWGFLSEEEVDGLLALRREQRALSVPFGEFALGQGAITPYQLFALVGRQRTLQPLIGSRLVELGVLPTAQVELHREKQRAHNARWK